MADFYARSRSRVNGASSALAFAENGGTEATTALVQRRLIVNILDAATTLVNLRKLALQERELVADRNGMTASGAANFRFGSSDGRGQKRTLGITRVLPNRRRDS